MRYSALTWVKVTIGESLKQTRQALEQFVENSSDTAPLQQCVGWLHEVYGVLKMLEMQTAALLVEGVETVIKALLAAKVEKNTQTYDILMRALSQLPNYLDHLAIVQHDIPTALLPLLNELRALAKQPPLAANALFAPDVSVSIPYPASTRLTDDKLKPHVQKLLAAYQKGLLTLIQNPKLPDGAKLMYSVMQHLQQVSGAVPLTKVWWISEGLLEALLQQGLEPNANLLNLLKQILPLIKQLADNGNAALRLVPPKALLTNLLYFSAHARSKGKQITAVKAAFNLQDFVPPEAALQNARMVFSGPDIELMKIVVTLLKDDFARVEETLDIFNRADNPSVAELSPLVPMLRDMANTLGLLGLTVQRQLILAQSSLIFEVTEGKRPANLKTLLSIANALLKVNAALDILSVQGVHARQRLQQSSDTQFSDTPQFGMILSVVVDEAKTELAQVIQPIVTFIDNNTQDEAFAEVPHRLNQVEGCLSALSHQRAAKLLAQCNQYIERVFIKENTVPPIDKQKALADIIVGTELYLDTLAGNPMDGKEILDIIEKRLAVLAK